MAANSEKDGDIKALTFINVLSYPDLCTSLCKDLNDYEVNRLLKLLKKPVAHIIKIHMLSPILVADR